MDGDADRVIYSFLDSNKKYHMLDGDKIATLVAGYLKELLQKSGWCSEGTFIYHMWQKLRLLNSSLSFHVYH